MPTLRIRDLDEAVYRRLSAQAQKARRSPSEQAAAILEEKLVNKQDRKEARRVLLNFIKNETDLWPPDLPAPGTLLQENEDR